MCARRTASTVLAKHSGRWTVQAEGQEDVSLSAPPTYSFCPHTQLLSFVLAVQQVVRPPHQLAFPTELLHLFLSADLWSMDLLARGDCIPSRFKWAAKRLSFGWHGDCSVSAYGEEHDSRLRTGSRLLPVAYPAPSTRRRCLGLRHYTEWVAQLSLDAIQRSNNESICLEQRPTGEDLAQFLGPACQK
jgi:hypothetical protein